MPLTVFASALGLSTVVVADAADSGNELRSKDLEEVIVTAQKQAEPLQDVPVPVATVSGALLTRSNQLRIEDYYRTVPGLALAPRGNGGEPTIAIRGLTTGGNSNPTTGIVVDEVSYGASVATGPNAVSAPDIDPGDVQRVEVLRGPQGTLYGASSIGGLLKFVTIDPSVDAFSGRFSMGTSSVRSSDDLGHNIRGNVNIPLGDTLAIRASGFTVHDPGYIDNLETGERDANDRDSKGGRLSALWRPSDDLSIKLSALLQNTERGGVNDVNTALGGSNDLRNRFLRNSGKYERDSEVYTATIVGNLGPVELTSATGYSKDDTFNNLDVSHVLGGFAMGFYGVDHAMTVINREVSKFSQELRASIPLAERVNWLVGAFYTDEKISLSADNQAADVNGRLAGSIFHNAYGWKHPKGPATFEEVALFTTFTVGLSERVDVQVGGRYSENEQSIPSYWSGPLAGLIYGSDPYFTPYAEEKDGAFTYLVTPRFKVSQDLMLYARFASGYRPGGINITCGHPDVSCGYDADTTVNYDFGAKGSLLDGALSFDASIYFVDWKDIQIADLITSDGLFFFTDNVSEARSRGVELTINTRLADSVKLVTWVAYNDAELRAALPPGNFFLVGSPGDRLPFSSRVSGSVSLDYEFPLGAAEGSIGTSLSYVGEREGGFKTAGLQREQYPSYTQVDLRAGVGYDSWNLSLFANNVTDKRGILRNGNDYGLTAAIVNYIQPRTVGVSLSKSF